MCLSVWTMHGWRDHLVDRKAVDPTTPKKLGKQTPGRDVSRHAFLAIVCTAGNPPTALREALSPQRLVNLPNKKTALTRIAAGDPAHVPVGRCAQAALTNLGLRSKHDPRLARADKLRSALSFVERGKVAAGIAYATDAAATTPTTATTAKAKAEAEALLLAMISAAAQPVWRAAGFIAAS